jgi:putative thioredoxin
MMDELAYIVESGDDSFEQDVLQASAQHLVLVDFWAPWCGPCRSLAPILEKLVASYSGSVRLVKVNTDEHQQLAARYGIRSLPTVFLFRNGNPVDQFTGVQPESVIRQMIDKHVVRESDERLVRAESLYASGDVDGALEFLVKTVSDDPDNDRPRLVLAEWLADANRFEDASDVLQGTSRGSKEDSRYAALSARIELGSQLKPELSTDELFQAIEQNPDDLESRFQLAGCLISEGDLAEALDHLLEIIRRDRRFRNDEPRQTILRVFAMTGGKGELVNKYRRELARALN